jgi:hypothetical protein
MSISPSVAIDTVKESSIPSSNGKTLYVGGTEEENYTTIQSAIDDANPGDTVFVYDESSPYYENVRVNKRINLIGENKNTTIINSIESGTPVVDIVPKADNVLVSGFTITDGYIGIYIYTNNNIIQGNKIVFNGYGIETARDANNNVITDNIIVHNSIVGIWEGCKDSYNTLKWNVISGNGDPDFGYGGLIKDLSGGNCHHNDFDLNRGCNVDTGLSNWGIWDDGSEGNYWYDWESNPGYPDIYIIPAWFEDQMDRHPSATPYFDHPIVCIYRFSYEAYPNEPIHFYSQVNKPISSLSFLWDFGDGNASNSKNPDHSYSKSGIYHINVTITDDKGVSDTDRSIAYIGFPPETPTITGPTKGTIWVWYNYSIVANDSDSDYLHYIVEANFFEKDIGPIPSGEMVEVSIGWGDVGNHTIYVKAIDETLRESEWAYLTVQIPRNRISVYSLFQWFLERFPFLVRFFLNSLI